MEQSYKLMRMDDNGARATVAEYADAQSAEQARAEYESRGHRQFYWVEPKEKSAPREERSVHMEG